MAAKARPVDLEELASAPYSVLQEAHLAQEVAFAVLDSLTAFANLNKVSLHAFPGAWPGGKKGRGRCQERLGAEVEESRALLRDCLLLHLQLIGPEHSSGLRLHALHALAGFVKAVRKSYQTPSDLSKWLLLS